MAARIVPFGVYPFFLLVEQGMGWYGHTAGWSSAAIDAVQVWIYPVKIIVVVAALAWYWGSYSELQRATWPSFRAASLAIGVGVVVYLAWVRMDWPWAMQGERSSGYNPFSGSGGAGYLLAACRIIGAAAIVPIMEELFWRSFLMRYLISSKFQDVAIGAATPFSFAVMTVLFGVEHDLWLAGMMAGAAYGLLLITTKSLWACVVSHAVTNFALGIHVLITHDWYWW